MNRPLSVHEVKTLTTTSGPFTKASNLQTQPEQHDLQFRHTFAASEQHELSWGAEFALLEKSLTLIQENSFHRGLGQVPSDRLAEQDQDRSRNLWLSERFRIGERLNIQSELAWRHYTKTRDIRIFRDRVPPLTQIFPENHDRSIAAPRLGAAYAVGGGATLRGVYQKWLRPASYNSLAPIATAGIPVDDSLVLPGGILSRTRGQLDWELSQSWFITAFADRRKVDNLNSPLDGVLNPRERPANLDRVSQKNVANLAAPDLLEGTPIFARCSASSGGFTINHVLSRNFAGYLGYANTHAENTGAIHKGNEIPFLPKHRAMLGLT